MDWQGRKLMSAPGPTPYRQPMMANHQRMPQQVPQQSFGNDLGLRINDLDQRVILTEHANRAALDEVYALRDSIRKEISGSGDLSKQVRTNVDCIAGINVRMRGVEERTDDLIRRADEFQGSINRLEGQFLRNEGDKRLGNDAALREATQARQRVDELSRILDHQTRITDALSHEMSSMRGRIDLSDLRQRDNSRDNSSSAASFHNEKVELKNTFQEVSSQESRSLMDLKFKEIHNRINTIEQENAEKTAKISALEAENNQIRNELRNMKPTREISITQPSEGSKRSLENRFEQLVKEVDQCFGELGRQLQRESSARQELATRMKSSVISGESPEIEEKLSKIEHSIKEHQKVLYSPGFRAGNFTKVSGDLDLSKLFEELDKLNGKWSTQNGRLDDFGTKLRKIDQIEEKFNSDVKMIRARTVTLAEDIENIVANQDAIQPNAPQESHKQEDHSEPVVEERPKQQLRSKSMILEQQMLAESLGELKDNVHVIENQLEEKQTDLNIFKDQQNRLKENLQEKIRSLEEKLTERIENILSQPPKMSRTVSLGPDTGDIKKIKTDIGALEEKLEAFKNSMKPLVNEFRTGNLMSPAMTALHDQLIQVKGETDNLRKMSDSNRQKADAQSHEVKIRLRTLQDELERTQSRIDARNSIEDGDDIDVIISVDGKKSNSESTRQKMINQKLESLSDLEKKQERFEILVLKKLDELQRSGKPTAGTLPIQQREEKIKQREYKGEIEEISNELSKIWKILGDFRIELKRKELIHEDPSNIGALASAINEQMKSGNTGKKGTGGMKRTQSTDFDFTVDLSQRIEIVEKQIQKLGTGKIWKAVEAMEDDQNDIDKRLALVERKLIEVEDQSDVRSTFSASSKKSEKRTKKLKEEVESLKHKTIILENMLTDLKHANENMEDSIKKAKSAATKNELKRLATEVNEIKTKVMEPLTVKCSKMLVEMARKDDLKSIKSQIKTMTESVEKISERESVNIDGQLAKIDSSIRKELAKCLTQSDLEEVIDIATSARKSSANVRQELNNFTKRTKTRFEDFTQKIDEIQVKTNEELGNFFKKNTNLGLIKSIDEVRQYSSDLAEKIEIIEEALDELTSKNDGDLPNISRTSSKLSRLSHSDSRTALNDVAPFLEDLEGLKSQFADLKDSISKTYVSNVSFSEKARNFDEAIATVDELKQIRDIFEVQSASVRSNKDSVGKALKDVENLTKTVQVLNDFEKVFEKGVEEKFSRVFDRLCTIEDTTVKKSVHDDVQEMMDIQRTVSQTSQINEDSVRLMIKDYVDLEIENIRNSLKEVKEEVKSQHNFRPPKQGDGESFDINHDLIEAIEGGMREYINGKLDLYVTLAELETAVDARIERGGPPSVLTHNYENTPTGAPSRDQIVNAVEECVNKQTDQLVSLFVTKDKLLDLQRKLDELSLQRKKETVSESSTSLRSPSTASTITSYEISDKLDSNIREHIKSQMKHYITTSDMHGLIHEVQRLTESHKMLTDFKYDIQRQLKLDEKKISQLENALLDKSEQRLLSSSATVLDPSISLKISKLSEKIEDIEDSLKNQAFLKPRDESLSDDFQDLKLDFLRLKKHDIFEKINSFVTINDIRGLVVELSTISKDFNEMKESMKTSENPTGSVTVLGDMEILDDVENMINTKIEEIWPIVDEIVVKSILEYKPFEKYSDDSMRIVVHEEVQKFEPVLESIVESIESSRLQSPVPDEAPPRVNLSDEDLLELTSKTIVSQALFNGQQQIRREDFEENMNAELAQVQSELALIRHQLGQGQPDVVPRPDNEALKGLSDRLQSVETRMTALDTLSQRVHDLESEPALSDRHGFIQNQTNPFSDSPESESVQNQSTGSGANDTMERKIIALERRLDDVKLPNIESCLTELKSYFESELQKVETTTTSLITEFRAFSPPIPPEQSDKSLNNQLPQQQHQQQPEDAHRIKGIIDEFELNQFEFQNSIIKKIADVSDDLNQKIDKVKALTELSKSLTEAENKNFTPEQFSVRNMVYQTERSLKGEISQKVSVLGKTVQSDNFAIRELIREERKKHVRDMNDLEKRQAEVRKEFLELMSKVNKDKSSTVKATEKCEKKIKGFSSELKQTIKGTRANLDEVVEAFRDELGQNKIELKNSLKDTIEQSLQGKIAIDRLFARQCKVETNFDRFSREVKATIKFFTDQLEESE